MAINKSSFEPVVDVISSAKWLTLPWNKRLEYIRTNKYLEVAFFNQEPEPYMLKNEELSFKYFMGFINDCSYNYFGFLLKKDQFNDRYISTNEVTSKNNTWKIEKPFDLLRLAKENPTGYSENGLIFKRMRDRWDIGKPMFGTMGYTRTMNSQFLFPFVKGVEEEGYLPILEDLTKMKVLLILPDFVMPSKNDFIEYYTKLFLWLLEENINDTIISEYMYAKGDAKLREQWDLEGVDWTRLPSPVFGPYVPECNKKNNERAQKIYSKYDAYSSPEKLVAPDKKIIEGKTLKEKYDMVQNLYITWKDFYKGNKDVSKEPDTIDWGIKYVTTFDDKFRKNVRYDWPVSATLFLGMTTYSSIQVAYQMAEWGSSQNNTKNNFQEWASYYLATEKWLYDKRGWQTVTDMLGGEDIWPDVYTKPDVLQSIPTKPHKLSIYDTNDSIGTFEDLPEWQWKNKYEEQALKLQNAKDNLI